MDRNTIIGLVLIFGILIGFSYLNRPSQEEIELAKHRSDSLALDRAKKEKEYKQAEEEAIKQAPEAIGTGVTKQMGSFTDFTKGETKFITIENEFVRLKFSTHGGNIFSAQVKGFKSYSGDSLTLFSGNNNVFGLQFWGDKIDIKTQNLFFTPSTNDSLIVLKAGDEPFALTMRLAVSPTSYIDYIYSIPANSHMIDFKIHFTGMENVISARVGSIDLLWDVDMPRLEKGKKNESNYTTSAYRYPSGEYESLSETSEKDEEKITTKFQWLGYKHQFFSTFLVSEENFLNGDLSSTNIQEEKYTKHFSSRVAIPFGNGADETVNFKFYFGPNHFNTLKSYGYGFEEVVPLGSWIIKWINRYVVIFLFDVLDNVIASYGLIILLLTIIIKLVLFPLTYKSYLSQAKMRVLKPQVDEVNAKFPKKEDALKKQQAVMSLYKKVGVSPLGGCLPMLIQFPILFAMFRFFPASFELRQQSFLWADDLSSYDSILNLPFEIPFYGDHVSLFTILMAAALFFTTRISAEQMSDTNAQLPGMKFMMLYMMPLMLLFFFNSYSSGLSYYYFLSNVFTLGQTYLIRQTVDDAKILAKLHENAKKPVKKSSFQEKLENMAKQKQQQVRAKKK
jgi:YidC/Oxa1 family membrane protein insertase